MLHLIWVTNFFLIHGTATIPVRCIWRVSSGLLFHYSPTLFSQAQKPGIETDLLAFCPFHIWDRSDSHCFYNSCAHFYRSVVLLSECSSLLEHSVFVYHFLGNALSKVPKFYNLIILKTEYVHYNTCPAIFPGLLYPGMNRYQVAVF